MIAVHVTHEAVEKMGGIGAVIEGLVNCPAYRQQFSRTVLIGPMFSTDRSAAERLGPAGEVIYSSLDDIDRNDWARKFRPIERTYDVGIVYGTRHVEAPGEAEPVEVEVLLVDVFRYNRDRLNLFKAELFTHFAVPSDRFEHIWEFEQYVRLAEPAWEATHVIGCHGGQADPVVLMAHEYMGVPAALKAILAGDADVRTIFYGHEAASVRRVVEDHPGHDVMFYSLLEAGRRERKHLEEFFPGVHDFFKHPLVKAARYCDAVFAVGDYVGREMHFLSPASADMPVEIVYNGVPAVRVGPEQRRAHRGRMIQYAKALFRFEPDYVFTHVARPVLSKGMWRDLGVLHELDGLLEDRGKTAVYFHLGTLAGQRRTTDVLHMERTYGWPLHHRRGYPDLCNGEETVADLFEDFNEHHRAVRVVQVNQFGWDRRRCGQRMPADACIGDVRQGTDVEFGLSVYEPFGISQLEPLSAGAICVMSDVCGCLAFVQRCSDGQLPANILAADYLSGGKGMSAVQAAGLGRDDRDAVEASEARRLAVERSDADAARLVESGWKLAERLGWSRVVADYFLPAVQRTCRQDQLTGNA